MEEHGCQRVLGWLKDSGSRGSRIETECADNSIGNDKVRIPGDKEMDQNVGGDNRIGRPRRLYDSQIRGDGKHGVSVAVISGLKETRGDSVEDSLDGLKDECSNFPLRASNFLFAMLP